MTENKKKDKILKESTNPLNDDNTIESNTFSNSNNQGSIDSGKSLKEKTELIGITLEKDHFEKTTFNNNNSDSSLKVHTHNNAPINIIKANDFIINKKERYILEQKMKYELNSIYDQSNVLKKNNLKNLNYNKDINNKKYSSETINQINKNKSYILKRLVIIQIPLIFLVFFNIILFKILNNNHNFYDLYLYITSLSLSCALSGLTFFLIILILFGIFRHYYTSNIFRFLCLVNFCLSISLIIIQLIIIIKFKVNIKIEAEKKLTKIIIYLLIFMISGIIFIVNLFIGILAKESCLIIGGCKNENACPERKIKNRGSNKYGSNYIYFNDELNEDDINIKSLKKFHACINNQ